MSDAEAIDVIATHIIAVGARDRLDEKRDLYAEIGEQDWDAVRVRVGELAPFPGVSAFQMAWDWVAARRGTA